MDQFETALYALVEHCENEGLKEQMIHDRLVVGLCDSKLSERIVSEDKETFIAGTPVIVKVDTGADVTAISEEDFLPFVPNRSWTSVDAFSVNWMENHCMFKGHSTHRCQSTLFLIDPQDTLSTLYVVCTRLYLGIQQFKHFTFYNVLKL